MKKMCILLVVALLFSICPVYAEDEASVIATYKSGMNSNQGNNNWYYVYFSGNDYTEMDGYSTAENQYGRWNGLDGAKVQVDGFSIGWTYDVGLVFRAPMKGVVRFSGKAGFDYATAAQGDGAIVSVEKGGTVYWKESITYASPKECSVEIPVKAGEKVYFRINKNKNDAYDQVKWWPTAEYLAKAYTGGGTEGYKYLQRSNDGITELEFNRISDRFDATDGVAYMSDSEVLPSSECSMIKRYEITEDGRYRINGTLNVADRRSSGNLVYIYKNDELLWQQLIPEAQTESFDIRVDANMGDFIDVEVKSYKYVGFNNMEWEYKITKFDGVLPFAHTSAGSGNTYGVDEEFTLGSKVGASLAQGTSVYAVWYDQKYPMTYASPNWSYTFSNGSKPTISNTTATLGAAKGDIGVDLTLDRTGILKIQGEFKVNEASNGVLTKIYLNDKEVWINREGGDALGRYDSPYDRNYFHNNINLTLDVKEGDKLTIYFGGWIKYTSGASIDFSKVKFKYISGEVLSKTTKWKLDQSIVIDTLTGKAYYNGTSRDVKVINRNYTNYISKSDCAAIFGEEINGREISEGGITYVPARYASETKNKNILWVSDRLLIIYDGLPMIYGTAECSEIDVALKGGVLFD